jgi:hypothetical protein
VSELEEGSPAGSAELVQLERLTEGGDGPLPAYLGGHIDVPGSDEDTWVVLALDGVVQGFSQLFPRVDTESAFSILLDQEVAAETHEVELFVTTGPDEPLRPLDLS